MNFTAPKTGGNWRTVGDPNSIQHIPGLKAYGNNIVGPIDAMRVLAHRGKHEGIPNPEDYYVLRDKPVHGLDSARDYQRVGIVRLVANLQRDGGVILADDMGLGKTLQTIGVWLALGKPAPLLVVAPASVRRGWVKEFQKWAGLKATLVETGKQAAACRNVDAVVITSYELVKKLDPAFTPHMVVMDEAHLLRGRMAGRSQALLDICQVAHFRLALTGTPMWSRPRDFWMLLKILFGYRFGTADEFDYAYCDARVNQWGGKENKGASRLDELRLRLPYVMLRRTKESVASELPAFTRQIRWVGSQKTATKSLEAFALKQCTFSDALAATLDAKMDAAVEAAMGAGKFLLVTWRKKDAEKLHEMLNEEGYPCEIITGDYSHAEREAAIGRARQSGASVVCTIDSTNAGVDGLQHVASTCIFHALDYVPIKLAQMEARLHRIGQSQPVTAVYLAMEDSADQFVVETVLDKLDAWKATMGGDSTSDMGDAIGAPNMKQSEEAALAAIYAAMAE